MLHSNFAFIMFTTWFSHCWVTKALFGLPLFWVIWLSSHHSNWELRGTHWKYCVWLDFLSLFSSLKLSLSWATMQKIGNTKLVFSVSELHNSVATEPFPIISRLKPYLNKNASENPNYNHYLQPSPSTLEIRVKVGVGFIVFSVWAKD